MQVKMHDDYMQRKPLSRSTRRMSFKEARFETPSKDEVAMKKVSSYSQGEEGAEGEIASSFRVSTVRPWARIFYRRRGCGTTGGIARPARDDQRCCLRAGVPNAHAPHVSRFSPWASETE